MTLMSVPEGSDNMLKGFHGLKEFTVVTKPHIVRDD